MDPLPKEFLDSKNVCSESKVSSWSMKQKHNWFVINQVVQLGSAQAQVGKVPK